MQLEPSQGGPSPVPFRAWLKVNRMMKSGRVGELVHKCSYVMVLLVISFCVYYCNTARKKCVVFWDRGDVYLNVRW